MAGLQIKTVEWLIDAEGYLVSPAGTRIAKITRDTLWLYDKRIKTDLPFTLEDWGLIMNLLSLPRPTRG